MLGVVGYDLLPVVLGKGVSNPLDVLSDEHQHHWIQITTAIRKEGWEWYLNLDCLAAFEISWDRMD